MVHLTSATKLVWKVAAGEAAATDSDSIEPIHLLGSIAKVSQQYVSDPSVIDHSEGKLLCEVFQSSHISPVTLQRSVASVLPPAERLKQRSSNVIHRSEKSKRVFTDAEKLAGKSPATILHLLMALSTSGDRSVKRAIKNLGIDLIAFRTGIRFPKEIHSVIPPSTNDSKDDSEGTEGGIDRYGKDLTAEAAAGRISEIIGRRNEILRIIQALSRKKKNNPVLVGDAGVGKSAVVEALALRVVQGKDPQVLSGKRIVELNMGSLLAGTSLRGQFEERLTRIIKEASQDPNLILFIDEIHTVMGAGGGASDAANLLKPALARSEIKLIGATTTSEYRRHIEKDPALDRRFEKILIDEPSRDEALEMLKGIKLGLEKHHKAEFLNEALVAAVDLSIRLDVDNRLPDKAIDVLDRAGAQASVSELSYDPRSPLTFSDHANPLHSKQVTGTQVARAMAQKLGMPIELVLGQMDARGAARLLKLPDQLRQAIKGQDAAIEQVSERLMLAHSPVTDRRGPLAVMLFLGPSGVGKTELARQLALFLFGSDKNLIRFDMSEFKGEHTVSRLIGSPPGYVGSAEEGQFTRQIRSKPYSVVLLDEVEKAHQKVFDTFLQVFDEGRITDAKGRLCDARNCIFVLTTNIRPEMAHDNSRNALNEALKTWFRPELINRIDELVSFSHLSRESIKFILIDLLNQIIHHVHNQHHVLLSYHESSLDILVNKGYDVEYGARELRRTVEHMVQIPLSRLILSGELGSHSNWMMSANDDVLVFNKV